MNVLNCLVVFFFMVIIRYKRCADFVQAFFFNTSERYLMIRMLFNLLEDKRRKFRSDWLKVIMRIGDFKLI